MVLFIDVAAAVRSIDHRNLVKGGSKKAVINRGASVKEKRATQADR